MSNNVQNEQHIDKWYGELKDLAESIPMGAVVVYHSTDKLPAGADMMYLTFLRKPEEDVTLYPTVTLLKAREVHDNQMEFDYAKLEERVGALLQRSEDGVDRGKKPCRSPYCECGQGKCVRTDFYDARGEEYPHKK